MQAWRKLPEEKGVPLCLRMLQQEANKKVGVALQHTKYSSTKRPGNLKGIHKCGSLAKVASAQFQRLAKLFRKPIFFWKPTMHTRSATYSQFEFRSSIRSWEASRIKSEITSIAKCLAALKQQPKSRSAAVKLRNWTVQLGPCKKNLGPTIMRFPDLQVALNTAR